MSPADGRIRDVPIAIRRDKEMLDHAVRAQQVDPIQKQLWIRGNALTDGVCQFEPLLTIFIVPGTFISLEQRYQPLNQEREIKGIGVASAENQALLVKRHSLLGGVVANLRTQMPGSHSDAGFVDLNPVLFREGLLDLFRDFEIGAQCVGRGALRHLDQPSRISHEHRLISRGGCPEMVEQALKVREPIAGGARFVIPQAHTQQLEAANHIQVEQRMRVANSTIATRPARPPPQIKGACHHLGRIDQAVMQSRHLTWPESTRPMRFFQLTSKTRLAVGDTGECEEAILKVTRQKGTVLQVFDRFSLGVQQCLNSVDDFIATGQEEPEKFDL